MMRAMHETAAALIVAAMALSACGPGIPRDEPGASLSDVTGSIARLDSVRVFFAHQSVGDNIMDGVGALMKEIYADASGGFLAHASLGVNGNPRG